MNYEEYIYRLCKDADMTDEEEATIKWLESLKSEIGKSEHRALWHYAEAIDMAIEALKRKPILCSHCKHYIRHDHRCGWWNHRVSNVDWCSYAERREE